MSEKISRPKKEKAAALLASIAFTAGACDKSDLDQQTEARFEQAESVQVKRNEDKQKEIVKEYTTASDLNYPNFAEKGTVILKLNSENGEEQASHGKSEDLENIDQDSYDFVPFRQVDILETREKQGESRQSYRADRNVLLNVPDIEGEANSFEFSGRGSHLSEAINNALLEASEEKGSDIPKFIRAEGGDEESSVKTDSGTLTGVEERSAFILDGIQNLQIETTEGEEFKVNFIAEVQDIPENN